MDWEQRWSGKEAFLNAAESAGFTVRTPLAPPVLNAKERWVRDAFVRLSNARSYPQPVSLRDIAAHVTLLGHVGTRDQFVELIQRLDTQWLKNQS